MPFPYIRQEGRAGRMGLQLMAIVAEGDRQRVYLPPTADHVEAARVPPPEAPPPREAIYRTIPEISRLLTTG